jgi:hypothetical protein
MDAIYFCFSAEDGEISRNATKDLQKFQSLARPRRIISFPTQRSLFYQSAQQSCCRLKCDQRVQARADSLPVRAPVAHLNQQIDNSMFEETGPVLENAAQ